MYSHGAVAGQKIISLLGKVGGADRQYNVLNGVTDIGTELQYWLTELVTSKDGVTNGVLVVEPGIYRIGTDVTIPAGVTVKMDGGEFSIDSGKTLTVNGSLDLNHGKVSGAGSLTFASGSSAHLPEAKQCFDVSGGLTVTFNQDVPRRPEWWGAKADNSTAAATNVAAFAAMIASLPSSWVATVVLQPGIYLIEDYADSIAVNFSEACVVNGNGAQLRYGAGTNTAVKISHNNVVLHNMVISRSYTADGSVAADTTLQGTGLHITGSVNFRTHNINISGFQYGVRHGGVDVGACSYGEHHNPVIQDNLIGMHFDSVDNANAYTTDIYTFGGRIDIFPGNFSDVDNSRLVEIADTNTNHHTSAIRFYETTLEQKAERKVKCAGHNCSWDNCYWEAGAFDTGQQPYQVALTGVSYTSGSATLTKVAHGATVVVGDLVVITSATDDENIGYYTVVSSTVDTIVLDQKMYGTNTDLALTLYRANLEFTSTTQSCQLRGGHHVYAQGITDLGEYNDIIGVPRLGTSKGSLMPPQGYGKLASGIDRRSVQNIQGNLAGELKRFFTNAVSSGNNPKVADYFQARDSNEVIRQIGRLKASVTDDTAPFVRGLIGIYSGIWPNSDYGFDIQSQPTGDTIIYQFKRPSAGTTKLWTFQSDAWADETLTYLPDAVDGFGRVMVDNGAGSNEWAHFNINAAGTVVLEANSVNVVTGTTDTKLCFQTSGTNVIVRNRLGASYVCRIFFWYN